MMFDNTIFLLLNYLVFLPNRVWFPKEKNYYFCSLFFVYSMLSSVFLFTWEEKYLLHQELKRRTDWFVQKYWSDSLFVYKNDFSLESVRQSLYSWWLFVQKKMIIIYWAPTDLDTSNKVPSAIVQSFSDEFIGKKWSIWSDTILIFVSYKPDKRTKFYLFLKKELDSYSWIKEFAFLKSSEIKQLIRQKNSWLHWSDLILDLFLTKTGNSLFHIYNELDKLVLWSTISWSSQISEKEIDLLVFGLSEANNFLFFDLVFSDRKKALSLISDLQQEGANRNAFLWTLYWWLKIWLFVLDSFEQWTKDSKTIASSFKLHPFVVSKTIKYIDILSCNKSWIFAFYRWLLELEYDIKTGKKSDFNFWLDVKKMVYVL